MERKLSEHFYLSEFLESQTARRLKFDEQFEPHPQVIENLQILVDRLLQPVRYTLRGSIYISSGYRCNRLNESVNGKLTSQHLVGQAVDCQYFENGRVQNLVLFNAIIRDDWEFDQLLKEYGTDLNPAWIHVSYKSQGKNRMEILTI